MDAGKWTVCTRCSGTGEARYNHLNGDTHCYLCDGRGLLYRASAAEKARQDAEDEWAHKAYSAYVVGGGLQTQLRRPVRAATETTPWLGQAEREALDADELAAYEAAKRADREAQQRMMRAMTFWVDEGMMDMRGAQQAERQARQDAALAAAKASPDMAKKLAAAAGRRAAREAGVAA